MQDGAVVGEQLKLVLCCSYSLIGKGTQVPVPRVVRVGGINLNAAPKEWLIVTRANL